MQEDGNIPDRFTWALEIVDVKSTENILEIGCGAGVLAALIAGNLRKGKVVALDKSKSMGEKAAKRLDEFVSEGRAEVVTKDFIDFNPGVSFDKVLAFNVNFFWKDSNKEFEVLRNSMRKGSLLFVFYDAPGKVNATVIDGIKKNLLKYSFQISAVSFMNKDRSVFCIKAVWAQG
jgi:cyclopropane fatty-acyl-phospholipid synthase-like methyltransferase